MGIAWGVKTLERLVTIQVTGDGWGHMAVTREVVDGIWSHNKLSFTISSDQSFLGVAVLELGAAIQAYPVIGSFENELPAAGDSDAP